MIQGATSKKKCRPLGEMRKEDTFFKTTRDELRKRREGKRQTLKIERDERCVKKVEKKETCAREPGKQNIHYFFDSSLYSKI
jgi:hypothetical protein